MSLLVIDSLKNAYTQIRGVIAEKTDQAKGHAVAYLKIGATYLQDPRYASVAVFGVNFGIFEIAWRISKLVELVLPDQTKAQANIQFACRLIVGTSLVIVGNMSFVKAFDIKLHPLVISALAIASLIVRHELASYTKTTSKFGF